MRAPGHWRGSPASVVRTHYVNKSASTPLELGVSRHEWAPKQPCEGHILGVICLGPAKLIGQLPRLVVESPRVPKRDWGSQETTEGDSGQLYGDLLSPAELVQNRRRL